MDLRLSPRELEQFRQLILRRSGILIDENRQEVLRFSLAQRLKATGHESPAAYIEALEDRSQREFQELIQLLTVGETFFFRTEQHWDVLRRHVLPELIEARRRDAAARSRSGQGAAQPTLRVWSAGCATGEEPYSLAILLLELLPDLSRWHVTLLGTDINEQVLDTAIRGQYSHRAVDTATDPAYRDRFFTPRENGYEVAARVRHLVEFRALNLVHDPYPSLLNNTSDMDLIVCRNVTLYFTREQAEDVQHKLYRALAPGGYLLLGHAETILDHRLELPTLVRDGVTFHVRPLRQPASPTRLALQDTYSQEPLRVPLDRWAESMPDTVPVAPPELRGEQHLKHGIAYLRDGRPDLARSELEEALRLLPRRADVQCALGEVCAGQSQEDQAIQHWQLAMDLNALYPLPYFFLGLLYKSRSEYQRAEEHLRQAIYLDPQMVLARFNLAQLYHAEGHLQEAVREYRNTRRHLQKLPTDQFVEHSEGFTIGLVQQLCDKAIGELDNNDKPRR